MIKNPVGSPPTALYTPAPVPAPSSLLPLPLPLAATAMTHAERNGTFRNNGSDAPDVLVTIPLQVFYLHSGVLKSVSRRFAAHMCLGRQDTQPVDGAIARQYRFYYGVDYDPDGNPSLQITSGEQDLGVSYPYQCLI